MRKRLASAYTVDGQPKYIRVYDCVDCLDRYTVVYTHMRDGFCHGVAIGESGSLWDHFEYRQMIDRPSYKHLGKKVAFSEMTADVQRTLRTDYAALWG